MNQIKTCGNASIIAFIHFYSWNLIHELLEQPIIPIMETYFINADNHKNRSCLERRTIEYTYFYISKNITSYTFVALKSSKGFSVSLSVYSNLLYL